MDTATKPGLKDEIAQALGWWRDAGVDGNWLDAPVSWLKEETPDAALTASPLAKSELQRRDPRPEPEQAPAISTDMIPGDLAAFTTWWATEPALDNGRTGGRIVPRGEAGAELMILVAEPEREDEAAGNLLSGPQGRLLEAMLGAFGIAPEKAYIASALPRHTPHADWAAAARTGLGAVLKRHIELVSPKRLIVFGSCVLPLLGHDPANSPAFLLKIDHGGPNLPVLSAKELAVLLEKPRWKAAFWRSWLEWNGSLETMIA